jgi:DNA excision repair protein ERCC-4
MGGGGMKIRYQGTRTVEFEHSFPNDFILVVDTREQDALFKRPVKGLVMVRDTIPAGDYSVRGFESEIVIERKSINDLYGSMFSDWDRESKKLLKIAEYRRKWLLIEGREDEVLQFQQFSTVHPNSMRGRLVSIQVRLGIPIYYASTRKDAERFVLDILTKYYRVKREGADVGYNRSEGQV